MLDWFIHSFIISCWAPAPEPTAEDPARCYPPLCPESKVCFVSLSLSLSLSLRLSLPHAALDPLLPCCSMSRMRGGPPAPHASLYMVDSSFDPQTSFTAIWHPICPSHLLGPCQPCISIASVLRISMNTTLADIYDMFCIQNVLKDIVHDGIVFIAGQNRMISFTAALCPQHTEEPAAHARRAVLLAQIIAEVVKSARTKLLRSYANVFARVHTWASSFSACRTSFSRCAAAPPPNRPNHVSTSMRECMSPPLALLLFYTIHSFFSSFF